MSYHRKLFQTYVSFNMIFMMRIASELEITLDNERKDNYMCLIKRDGSLKTNQNIQNVDKNYACISSLRLFILDGRGIFLKIRLSKIMHIQNENRNAKTFFVSLLGTYFTSSFRLIFVEKLSIKQLDLYTSGIE